MALKEVGSAVDKQVQPEHVDLKEDRAQKLKRIEDAKKLVRDDYKPNEAIRLLTGTGNKDIKDILHNEKDAKVVYTYVNVLSTAYKEAAENEKDPEKKRKLLSDMKSLGKTLINKKTKNSEEESLYKALGSHVASVALSMNREYKESKDYSERAYELTKNMGNMSSLHAVATGQYALTTQKTVEKEIKSALSGLNEDEVHAEKKIRGDMSSTYMVLYSESVSNDKVKVAVLHHNYAVALKQNNKCEPADETMAEAQKHSKEAVRLLAKGGAEKTEDGEVKDLRLYHGPNTQKRITELHNELHPKEQIEVPEVPKAEDNIGPVLPEEPKWVEVVEPVNERDRLLDWVVDNADLKPMTRAEVRKFAKENEMPKGMKLESDRDVLKTLAHWVTRGKESEVDAGLAIQMGKNQPWHEEIDGKTRKVKSINVYEANGETPAQIAVFYEGVEKVMEGDKEVEKPTMGILYYQQGSKEVLRTQFTKKEIDKEIKKRMGVEETPKQEAKPEKPDTVTPGNKGQTAMPEITEDELNEALEKAVLREPIDNTTKKAA